MKTKSLCVANLILLPAAALSATGNIELFGGPSLLGRVVVGIAASGLEIGMLTLLALGARDKFLRVPALGVAGFLLCLSLLGQYAFLLSRASGHEETIKTASAQVSAAVADESATRAELATVQTALDKEQKTGWGKNAQALAARADALRSRLDVKATQKETAGVVEASRGPLLILCERFDLPTDAALKIASAAFLVGLNLAGSLLLFAGNRVAPVEVSLPIPAPQPSPVSVPVARPVEVPLAVSAPVPYKFPVAPPAPWLAESRARINGKLAAKQAKNDAFLKKIGKR